MNEPQVAIGILSRKEIRLTFSGIYSAPGTAIISGPQEVRLSPGMTGVEWNGNTYPSIEFTPTSYDGDSFTLEDVKIGIDFHWEREESQRFRGSLRIIADSGRLTAINIINVEDYLASVISSEMSATSSLPFLQAHAVISRSWLLAQMEHKSRSRHSFRSREGEIIRWWDHDDHDLFDVCADDHCQRYQGIGRISSPTAASAVSDTRGEVLQFDGDLCDTRFSKCCGGVMERFHACWEDSDMPYLAAIRDNTDTSGLPDLTIEENAAKWISGNPAAFCNTSDSRILSQVLNSYDRELPDFYRWEEEYTRERMRRLVTERLGTDLGYIIDLKAVERGASGRIIRLRITGTKGEITIGKELMIRRTLSESHLRSSAFIVERLDTDKDGIPGRFRLRGAGWGHGVGLCQIGAAVMGDRGYSYDEILAHYYPGAQLTKIYY